MLAEALRGNSTLTEEMCDAGHHTIVNIDSSEVVIRQMVNRNTHRSEMIWSAMDATNMAFSIANTFENKINEDGTKSTVSGGIVGFFSLEMSSSQLATRILSENSKVPSDKIRRGDLS